VALKDRFSSDLDIFFNINEFAETIEINGVDMKIIRDNEELKKRNLRSSDGVYIGEVLLYVKKSDYGIQPAIGEIVLFGGRKKRIVNVDEEESAYIIVLEEFLSWVLLK